jgi:hypothetical protein
MGKLEKNVQDFLGMTIHFFFSYEVGKVVKCHANRIWNKINRLKRLDIIESQWYNKHSCYHIIKGTY